MPIHETGDIPRDGSRSDPISASFSASFFGLKEDWLFATAGGKDMGRESFELTHVPLGSRLNFTHASRQRVTRVVYNAKCVSRGLGVRQRNDKPVLSTSMDSLKLGAIWRRLV